jgi:hypothetical protein
MKITQAIQFRESLTHTSLSKGSHRHRQSTTFGAR